MKIVLPVAGNGIRLRPYTENLPKCLLPVAGKTIIDWIVDGALFLNPSETIFITGYKASVVDEFLKQKPETENIGFRSPWQWDCWRVTPSVLHGLCWSMPELQDLSAW